MILLKQTARIQAGLGVTGSSWARELSIELVKRRDGGREDVCFRHEIQTSHL